MIATNTTQSMGKASTVLADRVAATKTEMKKRMAAAGRPEYKMERVFVPLIPGDNDDVLFVGLNGQKFYFLRGQTVDMPDRVAEIYRNSGGY